MIDIILKEYKSLIDKNINKYFPDINTEFSKVVEAARYSLLLGGKRIRPIIMLEFAKLFGGNREEVMPFAVALEMIHTYSLIHDDLPCMDNDDMRRGNPSCHIKYGEDIALLAGDTLLTESFNVALKSTADSEKKLKALSVLSKRAGLFGMIGGQVMDLDFEINKPQEQGLRTMYLRKTGALLSAAAEIGAVLSQASDEEVQISANYALNVGLAFQIIDDILDIIGNPEILGKPIGSDNENDKTTLVALLGIEKSRELAFELTNEAKGLLAMLRGDKENLLSITDYLLDRKY